MKKTGFLSLLLLCCNFLEAQITDRSRPAAWNDLVNGGRFMDRFEAIPIMNKPTSDTWGGENVLPRDTSNGIEDRVYSYWGGNIVRGDDGKYHLYVCRWREDSPKGHMEWFHSIVVHAVADNAIGPYKVMDIVGSGHNPEAFQLKDGSYVIYVIDGYYHSKSLNGPWEYNTFHFDARDRPVIEGLSNLSFARREDGSFLMVCRGGGIWFSKDGISSYNQVSDKSVYPPVDGRFEDPVIWKTNIQYHMIVNDWYGRIAYYLRSKDGVNWKVDTGEAYMPGLAIYEDGTKVDWFKYERIKVLQDELGRAYQANFAVIDTLKHEDKPRDTHSSKNISIPLIVGRQIELLGKKKITERTKRIQLLIKAEEGFNPHTDIDLESLRFGASEAVNYGGGCVAVDSKMKGNDLIITFNGKGNGLSAENFVGKLLGKTSDGELLFGYTRLPWISYYEPILSPKSPEIEQASEGADIQVEIQNFGQVTSSIIPIQIYVKEQNGYEKIAAAELQGIEPFEKIKLRLFTKYEFVKGGIYTLKLVVKTEDNHFEESEFEVKVE